MFEGWRSGKIAAAYNPGERLGGSREWVGIPEGRWMLRFVMFGKRERWFARGVGCEVEL